MKTTIKRTGYDPNAARSDNFDPSLEDKPGIALALTVLSEADRHPHKQVGAWQTSVVLAREVVAQGETIAELRKALSAATALVGHVYRHADVKLLDQNRELIKQWRELAEGDQAALTELEESE